ncbi:dynamin family protein [Mycolicibacterium phlei]|jgi:replication fork clamp-binding protein CrfC|uniref:Isoniazid-inducible protein iniA n=1 Tax=Mycolicibacterium phlei DSM 43239 = CCUG 21000 TaxID=1226750 RepID=A0A5N5VFR7_MYCPH|nr:dynamin-like GTPase family protein [Mycolicibacterium phlei]VEG11591.1 dynamin family protein [Mycobacteroides chelonae]AMO63497.1 Isoniazid-induced protein IniA [Mycolicibacterium phlei]EID14483.1 dynamin family protein [Mycolicibacterium phlei RIVM601174]KAB7759657.1 Isoniazid-inducible protein iniA [Mycolicibacterium phlei DSM 43239 = CCUG 21000]KXW63072.1 Isoniazid-inducible protein iniA [Mycolicibacterium phlei DSM 43070]
MTDKPNPLKVIVELIDHTSRIAETYDRGDLVDRLARAKARITDPQIRVVVAGQLKQGKSQLLNSLLNVPVARVGDDESTVLATVVTYGETPSAKIIVKRGEGEEPEAIEIPMTDIGTDLRRHPLAGGREVLRVEVTANSPLLKNGLAFVDTPGVGGHGQPHLSATLGLLPDADAVLMCSDTSQEFTEPEMTFMRQAFEICPVATIVATKIDLYPHWRQIVEVNRGHLQRAGLSVPIIPASALLRSHAIQLNDKELNEESNFPAIVKFLSEQVLAQQKERIRNHVVNEIYSAAEHLTLKVQAELSALNDPGTRERLKQDLERRKQEAQEALQQTALWQQVLNDGISDLTADVDHDLRGRFRVITQHIEQVIDSCDPTQHWAEIGAELEEAVATAVGDNFVWAYQRAEALAAEVARTFVEAGLESVSMPQLDPSRMGASLGELKPLANLEAKRLTKGRKLTMGMQGSYGGVLMFGMMTSFAGLGMFNPISLGAGLLMGRTAYKEGVENRMARVRNEAKLNTRRFIDDTQFAVAKESRDRLKAIQRQLRDHYREIANQTTRSLNESLQAMIAAAQVQEAERNNRIKELERALNILNQVTEHAVKLMPESTPDT